MGPSISILTLESYKRNLHMSPPFLWSLAKEIQQKNKLLLWKLQLKQGNTRLMCNIQFLHVNETMSRKYQLHIYFKM